MKINSRNTIWGYLTATVLILVVTGCVNLEPKLDPTRFYVLNVPLAEADSKSDTGQEYAAVKVRSLQIADYLDRPEIMVRYGDSRVERQSTQRWAGDLKMNVQNELARWWSTRQSQRGLYFPPWEQTVSEARELRWKISKLEGYVDAEGQASAVVAMEWSWKTEPDMPLHYIRGEWSAPWDGVDYTSLVSTLGNLLAQGYEEMLSSEP